MKLLKIIVGVSLMLFTSCDKGFLERDNPNGTTDDKWWETEANALNALNAVYSGVSGGTTGKNTMLLSSLSDETVHRDAYRGNYEVFVKGLHNSDWDVALSFWKDSYIYIRRANRFLENVDKVYMEKALKDRYIAEARALRAYYHAQLLMYFGDVPIVTKSINPEENFYAKNSKEEVFDFVVNELNAVAPALSAKYTTTEEWRISAAACYGIITRVALFFEKYEIAKESAFKIIDSQDYSLYINPGNNKLSYTYLFTYDGMLNSERIFFKKGGNSGAWDYFAPATLGGRLTTSPTASMVDNFETRQGKTIFELGTDSLNIYKKNPNYRNNRDPRLTASVLLPGDIFRSVTLNPFDMNTANINKIGAVNSTATGYWIKKYLDEKDFSGSRTLDFVIIRYAEILLSYAEALIELNDITNPDIVKYINEVRNRAGMPNVNTAVYNNQTKLKELIRRERQAELAFEGVRYFDIRRWGLLEDKMNGTVYGATNPNTGIVEIVEQRKCDPSRDFWFPIPSIEINANPNLIQNTGY